MASKIQNPSNVSTSASTSPSTTTTTARRPARKPPVIERIGINALGVPRAAPPVTPAPATPPDPAPAAPPGPSVTPAAAPAGADPAAPTAATPPAAPAGNGVDFPVDDPPQVIVPSVPAGFIPVNGLDLRGWRPMQSELASVPDAIRELNDFPDYTALFGITAPPVSQVSARLMVAAEWTTLFTSTSAWYTYVKSQEGMAWKDALELVDKLKTPFQLAAASNPALLNQYPAIARMLVAKKVVSKRATSTRTKKQKAKQAEAVATAVAAATAAAAAPVTAAPAAAPARVVTVQG